MNVERKLSTPRSHYEHVNPPYYMRKKRGDPVFFYLKGEEDWHVNEPPATGYYFWDETWSNWQGPFETQALCEIALKEYAKSL